MALHFKVAFLILLAHNVVDSLDQSNWDKNHRQAIKNTCNTDDLNHSTLVECKTPDCNELNPDEPQIWPNEPDAIIHMYSSRSGDRFELRHVKNINYTETIEQKWFDINTTLYVDTNQPKQEILGFGTKLDLSKLPTCDQEEEIFSIIRDLFGKEHSGIEFSVLVVPISANELLGEQVPVQLNELDCIMRKTNIGKIKVILNLTSTDSGTAPHLRSIADSFKSFTSLQFWAVVIPSNGLSFDDGMLWPADFMNIFSSSRVFAYSEMGQVADIVGKLSKEAIEGLLMKSDFSAPYDILTHVYKRAPNKMMLITIADDKPQIVEYGDWQNAQHYAVEILKHFENGVNGFVEDSSVANVLADTNPRDSSIYTLHRSHTLHFRGPMFYAIGHFSRHVVPGSKRLASTVFTQPNMFAAHYQAFLTPQNHVVAIVLNDNEHLLPFRLSVNKRIIANINLKPKSFNTIVLNA